MPPRPQLERYFVITRDGAPAKSGLNHILDIGYRDGPKFRVHRDVWAEQQLESEANSTCRQECIDYLLCRYPQEVEVRDDEIRSGSSDPTCKLFTKVGSPGVPTLSRFSESSSCWHLRVTLTPERPSYNSCTMHLLHPAH